MVSRLSDDEQTIRVCLLISSLEFGGAERQVIALARSFDRDRVKPTVCSLSDKVPLARLLPDEGQNIRIIKKRGRFDFTAVFRVARLLRQESIDVVHAFLFDAEIVARLAAPLARVPVVVASERNSNYTRPLLHRVALRLTQPLFDVMVANSYEGKRFNMRTLRLPESRIEVVHNGVDVEHFCPNAESRRTFRARCNIPADDPVIGMIGSFKRQKAHDSFLRMAARAHQLIPRARFLIVGEVLRDGYAASRQYKAEILELAKSLVLSDRCVFLEKQNDMKAVYNACDLTVLLSTREGTPNVLLESMACGVPVIASDVADNSIIVLDKVTGHIVAKGEDAEAATYALELLWDPAKRIQMGAAARQHVCRHYSIRESARKMEDIYRVYLDRRQGHPVTNWRSPVSARTGASS